MSRLQGLGLCFFVHKSKVRCAVGLGSSSELALESAGAREGKQPTCSVALAFGDSTVVPCSQSFSEALLKSV